ncbi:hypothetical protein [Pedobacter africanus]|uniref:Uncharacterized protein n=1 Tax=Pedobacter africanus TaxID=151894 RepID=A0A1W2A1V3_9SPHI|nr:hypothetical protein [Pedobacter africanus]SMC54593.1 hypothetical protein SAMN04488524_1162 [Pedobacter africanus]
MKRIKFLLVFVFLLVGTLTVLALSNKGHHKSVLTTECLRYQGVQPATPISILDPINWSSMLSNPGVFCNDGDFLCAICFDNFQMTPSEARQILSNYQLAHGTLPLHGQSISNGGRQVTVYLKE